MYNGNLDIKFVGNIVAFVPTYQYGLNNTVIRFQRTNIVFLTQGNNILSVKNILNGATIDVCYLNQLINFFVMTQSGGVGNGGFAFSAWLNLNIIEFINFISQTPEIDYMYSYAYQNAPYSSVSRRKIQYVNTAAASYGFDLLRGYNGILDVYLKHITVVDNTGANVSNQFKITGTFNGNACVKQAILLNQPIYLKNVTTSLIIYDLNGLNPTSVVQDFELIQYIQEN
jgi:hypothetical protein